ncbi:MAG TPA: DUF4139 domain-containing protein [Treponema sp.]|nr:DUF4139 domain-containing protein [Treponema sp.]
MNSKKTIVFSALLAVNLFIVSPILLSQTREASDLDLSIKKISLFSSGVSFVEHSGRASGSVSVTLPFHRNSVNDVLKSLVIHDPQSADQSITYASEDTLQKTLQSLSVDLSRNPGIAEILDSLRGSEVSVCVPETITGRIIGVETQLIDINESKSQKRSFLNLHTDNGLRRIELSEVSSFTFTDPVIKHDFNRALDLLLSERTGDSRLLRINLSGTGDRELSLGYVVSSPVWKVSYRLDLSNKTPALQGWAIIDNASDYDWKNVELTLVSGRPVSFIQQLYPPFYLQRPEVPLSIAGAAKPTVYSSSMNNADIQTLDYVMEQEMSVPHAESRSFKGMAARTSGVETGVVETAVAQKAGELFLYTLKTPVTIDRRQSSMVPLVEAKIDAKKVSVFSGKNMRHFNESHPMLCVELINNSGTKLPAGPITIFDSGSYAGDGLLEFFPEKDSRLVSYGEDLAVSGTVREDSSRALVGVKISRGVMTVTRKQQYTKTYQFKNSSDSKRSLLIEHPITTGADLVEPSRFDEQTATLYRFPLDVLAGKTGTLTVREDQLISETVVLQRQEEETLLYYASSSNVPAKVKKALEKAIEIKHSIASKEKTTSVLEIQKKDKIQEQERVRVNIHAVGNSSQQGQEYLKKLVSLDKDIDILNTEITSERKDIYQLKNQYDQYLESLSFE